MVSPSRIRVAVDIGGTFTDLHLFNCATGETFTFKTPSTPNDPSIGLLAGLQRIAKIASVSPSDIGMILHGSTIATNAVLERKLPKGALLTTAGFEDILEIGRHMRQDVYTLKAEQRPLLIPRHLRFGIDERIKYDGTVLKAPDRGTLEQVVEKLLQQEIETVAVVFLHSYRNPAHEQQVKTWLAEIAPHLSVATSFESSPEIREYERSSTTVLNALLQPVISSYLENLGSRLTQAGINSELYLVQSNGGLASPEDAALLPARLLLSGPAGGATAMAMLARRHSVENLVGFDVGGTSSDISVVSGGSIGETQESSIDGLPVRLPMVDIRTIGSGGGSIARVENNGLRVGPQSAGADPGPVCYNLGGEKITVTDANAILGFINAESFNTGGISLNISRAAGQLDPELCSPLGLTREQSATGVLEVANSLMADAIRLSLFEKGADPGDFALAPFGGAAGLHACAVARELGMQRIVFPAHASTLSALGILQADLQHDLSVSTLLPADISSLAQLQQAVIQLSGDANDQLQRNGVEESLRRIEYSCDMRYRGQAFELTTPWPEVNAHGAVEEPTLTALIDNFHQLHEELFTFTAPEDPVEIVAVRARAIGKLQAASDHAEHPVGANTPAATTVARDKAVAPATRELIYDGTTQEFRCISRDSFLATGKTLQGPLLIEEEYTVLLIAPGWQISPLPGGDIACEYLI